MKKTLSLLISLFLLNGCVESVALFGTTVGGASSRIVQTSIHTVTSYGVKKQTGKTPLGHALAYAEKNKKKTNLTEDKIINKKKQNKSLKELSLSTQSSINKKSKIEYLD